MGNVDFAVLRDYGKRVGVKITGKKAEDAKTAVMDGIQSAAAKAKETKDVAWAKANVDLIDWYNAQLEVLAPTIEAAPEAAADTRAASKKEALAEAKAKAEAAKKKAQETKEKKAPAKKKGSRADAFAIAIKKGGTKEALIGRVNAEYIKMGGTDNVREATWAVNYGLNFLIACGFAKEADGKFSLV